MSFRIEEWQVMQAHKNGARISSTSRVHQNWVLTDNPEWNWKDNDYRISDLTYDLIRLDDLVEKYPSVVTLQEEIIYDEFYRMPSGEVQTLALTGILCENPEMIGKVKVNKENNLRPWTMDEFEKHRDEWFVSRIGSKRKVLQLGGDRLLPAWDESSITYEEFMKYFLREDGSPCGVLE